MKFAFTYHAIERFISRHAQELSHDEARAYLEGHAHEAVRLKTKTWEGSTMWRIDHVTLVTVRDPGDTVETVVTILPARADYSTIIDDELALALEQIEARGAYPRASFAKIPNLDRTATAKEHQEALPIELPIDPQRVRKADINAFMHSLAVEKTIESTRSKTLTHLANRQSEFNNIKRALRIALRALQDGSDPEEAFRQIEALDPGFVNPDFIRYG